MHCITGEQERASVKSETWSVLRPLCDQGTERVPSQPQFPHLSKQGQQGHLYLTLLLTGGGEWRIDAPEHPLQITKCYLVDTIVQFLKGIYVQGGSILRCTCRPPSLAVHSTTAHGTSGALENALLRKRRSCQGQGQRGKSRGQGLLGLHVLQDGSVLQGRNPPHHSLAPFSWDKCKSSFLSADIMKLRWHQAVWMGVPPVYRNELGTQALSTQGP